MASFKVEVISNEMIKPSYPTPESAKTFQLSFFDQVSPAWYMPLLYFYPNEKKSEENNNINLTPSMILKNSLAETLVHYYPLAGRIKMDGADHPIVDCNDEGAEFYETRVSNMELSSVLDNRNNLNAELVEFLPFNPATSSLDRGTAFAVKVNYFGCGGIIIGMLFSHKIGDAKVFIDFVNTWASIAQGKDNKTSNGSANKFSLPEFDLACHFPPRDLSQLPPIRAHSDLNKKEEKIIFKRFKFDKKQLDMLKEQAYPVEGRPPSKVEAISAFYWKMLISLQSTRALVRDDIGKLTTLFLLIVNLRARVENTDIINLENKIGNICWNCITKVELEVDHQIKQHELVEKIRESKRNVDGKLVRKLQTEECLLEKKKDFEVFSLQARGALAYFGISSLCHFPIYDANFGWGKPEWVTYLFLKNPKNMAMLWDTKCGEGVEGLVSMLETDLADFEDAVSALV